MIETIAWSSTAIFRLRSSARSSCSSATSAEIEIDSASRSSPGSPASGMAALTFDSAIGCTSDFSEVMARLRLARSSASRVLLAISSCELSSRLRVRKRRSRSHCS